ncbi:MAG: gliding motility-associated C-terminal domain-containing protein [Bacteroidia bacterium]|nr:gliding motility-associated C-terminal domain-containing protein [Bacteroidia bacterium]
MKHIGLIMCIIAGAFFLPGKLSASHTVAGDISAKMIGPLQYEINLRLFGDCVSFPPGTQFMHINYTSASKGLGGNKTLTIVSTNPNGLPAGSEIDYSHCVSSNAQTSCNGGVSWGVREYHYSGIVTLPVASHDWKFTFTMCCRNATIDNLANGGGESMHVYTMVDNDNVHTNSSPTFARNPVAVFCVGSRFYYHHQGSDPDGDSLVYSLTNCLDGPGSSVAYAPPFSPQQPLVSLNPPGFRIDSITGLISFTATLQMTSQVCVLIEEFRAGVKIGEVLRDMQFNIYGNCITNTPLFLEDTLQEINSKGIRASCGDSSLVIPLSQSVLCETVASDGSDLRMFDASGLPIPIVGAEVLKCISGDNDSLYVKLHASLNSGTYTLYTKKGFDGNVIISDCGSEMLEFDTLIVYVPDSIIGVFDGQSQQIRCDASDFTFRINQKIACNTISTDASEFKLYNKLGAPIVLDSLVGLECSPGHPYSRKFKVWFTDTNPSYNFPLHLILSNGTDSNTVQNSCGVYFAPGDTLAWIYSRPIPAALLGNDTSLCNADTLLLSTSISTGQLAVWTHNESNFISTKNSILVSNPGSYVLTIIDSFGCKNSDTISIYFNTYVIAPSIIFCFTGINNETDYEWNSVWGASNYEVSVDGEITWIPANNLFGPLSHAFNYTPQQFNVRSLSTVLCSPSAMSNTNSNCQIIVPNCITPNGDGYNDEFRIPSLDHFRTISLRVYNTWGKVIYESDDYKNNWKAEDQPDGNYFYVIKYDGAEEQKGVLKIMR